MSLYYSSPEKLSRDEMKALAADVVRLSKLLTRDREALPAAYLKDEGLRKAYRTYFLPSNSGKIHIPLKDLSLSPKKPLAREKLRILDLGSGPGTSVLGVMEFFARNELRPELDFIAVDHVAENLRETEALFGACRPELYPDATLKTIRTSVEQMHMEGWFDLIILSNLMNELFHVDGDRTAKRVAFMKSVLGRFLAHDGSCIIIEPALRETSRGMLEVRDGLLEHGYTVYSPCLGSDSCPVLADPRDWCHEDLPWDPPALIKELDRLVGLRKDSLKFSYLVLRKDGLSLADIQDKNAFRIVSEPLVSRGKKEFYICGHGLRKLVTRLDKDTTSLNGPFENLKRGEVAAFEGLMDEGKRFKVTKETRVITAAVAS